MELNRIIQGHTPDILKTFPAESIDCGVTSPPFWALRDYQTEPQIWGGYGGNAKCQHEWGQLQKTLTHKSGETNPGKEGWYKDKGASDDKGSNFCSKCNVWRGSLGLEPTFELYIKHLCDIFDEFKRVLKKTGTLWVNIGDTYWGGGNNRGSTEENLSEKQFSNRGARGQVQVEWDKSYPTKSLCLIPARFAIAMTDRGWILRNKIIWHKKNCMPSSVKDRFTVDYKEVFFFVKSRRYYFEQQFDPAEYDGRKDTMYHGGPKDMACGKHERWKKRKNDGTNYGGDGSGFQHHSGYNILDDPYVRNKRCIWSIPTRPFKGAHFAVFPEALVEPMIKAGCPQGGVVLDPFMGAGTTAVVAKNLGRNYIGIELNPKYIEIAEKRLLDKFGMFK